MAGFELAWHFATAISSMVLFDGWHGIAVFISILWWLQQLLDAQLVVMFLTAMFSA